MEATIQNTRVLEEEILLWEKEIVQVLAATEVEEVFLMEEIQAGETPLDMVIETIEGMMIKIDNQTTEGTMIETAREIEKEIEKEVEAGAGVEEEKAEVEAGAGQEESGKSE